MSRVKQNIRIRFTKDGGIRFISHHDLMRVFERALRRAELPVAMSEGYHPRPRISLPAALSVGYVGRNEVADVGLDRWVRPEDFRDRLEAELPEGIRIASVELTSPHPDRQPTQLSYRIPLLPGHDLSEAKLQEVLSCRETLVVRKRKDREQRRDIRPYIEALRLENGSLHVLLSWDQTGTARPEEVMQALGCREGKDYLVSAIERTHVKVPSSK